MKSKNHLSLTGTVVSPVVVDANQTTRFTIRHDYGGPIPPLFLKCVIPNTALNELLCPGDSIHIEAYLRPRGNTLEAILK